MVATRDLKSLGHNVRAGSSPAFGTKCNDLEISDGTNAKYEMETLEACIKMWIRNKPYRRYI